MFLVGFLNLKRMKNIDKILVELDNGGIDIFFEKIDLKKSGITGLKKEDLLAVIEKMNKLAVDSVRNWDGG